MEVERTGSITQAAENLFMGQPNLSKAIMELEETLGFQIFERTSKGVIPTQKGVTFLVYAKNILAGIEKMEALSDRNSAAQTLSLAFVRSMYIASAVRKQVSELDPQGKMRLNIRETGAVQVMSSVAASTFNFGIVRYRLLHERYFLDYMKDKELDAIPFWEFDSMVLTSKRNCTEAEKLTYSALSDMTQITYGDESIPYLSFGEVRREAKSPAADKAVFVYDRATAMELLESLPMSYMLTAPMPQKVQEAYGFLQKKCEIPNERVKDVIVFQRGYQFTPIDRRFIDILSEIKNESEFQNR